MKHLRSARAQFDIRDKRRVNFYAAIFDEPSMVRERDTSGMIVTYREVIRPGAFFDSLNSGSEVIANIDHDPNTTFARTTDKSLLLQEDPHGLFASAWIPEGDYGDAILADVEAGEYGCSFKFLDLESRSNDDLTERIKVKLIDVCLTKNPVYEGTEAHVRSRQHARQQWMDARLKLLKIKTRNINTDKGSFKL